MSTILNLPNSLDSKANKILVFDCLLLLGDELGEFFDSKMRIKHGEEWMHELSRNRGDFNLTLNDPDFVIEEPLRSDSPLRAFLPNSPTFYRNLDILRKVRNYVAHNKFEGKVSQTIEVIQVLLQVSMDLNLTPCTNEYAAVFKRLNALEDGEEFVALLPISKRVEEIEERSAELEEELFEEKKRSRHVAQSLEEARSKVSIMESELEAIREDHDVVIAMSNDLETARLEVEALRGQAKENLQKTEALMKNEASIPD